MRHALLLLVILLPFGMAAQPRKFPPRDQSRKVASLKTFVDSLKVIVRKKDSQALHGILHPEVKSDFDTGSGPDRFMKVWKPEKPDSELWPLLDRIISLGGVFTQEGQGSLFEFVFPYVNQLKFEDEDLYFETLVLTEKNVRVYLSPKDNSPVLGTLTYDVVTFNKNKSYDNWYFIETFDKKLSGYVASSEAWSPVGYRMFLARDQGRWLISCLVSGD